MMMYILTLEELQEYEEKERKKQKIINELCKRICDNEPVEWKGWGKKKKEPWGCPHSKFKDDEWYCDSCPVEKYCTMQKFYSQ